MAQISLAPGGMTGGPFLTHRSPPKVTKGQYTFDDLEALWVKHGGPRSVQAIAAAIALAESQGNPHAVNSIGATGLWQIHPGGPQYLDPDVNAATAVAKFKAAGNKFTPWTTYTGADTPGHRKTYLDYLPRAGLAGSAIPPVGAAQEGAVGAAKTVGSFLGTLSESIFSADWWLRVGLILLGVLAMAGGVYFIGREFVTKQAAGIVGAAIKGKE